jgi:hypothetical protein
MKKLLISFLLLTSFKSQAGIILLTLGVLANPYAPVVDLYIGRGGIGIGIGGVGVLYSGTRGSQTALIVLDQQIGEANFESFEKIVSAQFDGVLDPESQFELAGMYHEQYDFTLKEQELKLSSEQIDFVLSLSGYKHDDEEYSEIKKRLL